MDFVPDLIETGARIPTHFVFGVARAEIIDNCVVRITLYGERRESDGVVARWPECVLDWTIPNWLAARAALTGVLEMLALAGWTIVKPEPEAMALH